MFKVIKLSNIFMLLPLLGAVVSWIVCSLDYNILLEIARKMVVNADPSTHLTTELHSHLIIKLRYFSLMLLALTVIIFIFRKQLNSFFNEMKIDLKIAWKDFHCYISNFLSEDNLSEIISFSIIFVLAIILRIYYVTQPIRSDEALVFEQFAKQPFLVLISTYHNVGNHIFHTALMHLSWLLFGDSLWAIRMPVLLSGILLVPISFLAIRSIYGKGAAIIASSLIATSSTLVEYSSNSRGYEIQALLILCLFSLGIYLLKNVNRYTWLLWVIFTALGFWTVPTMFYAYGGLAVWFLISLYGDTKFGDTDCQRRPRTLRYFIAANLFAAVLTILLYSPVIIVYGLGGMTQMIEAAVSETGIITNFILSLKTVWLRNVPHVLHYPLILFAIIGIIFQYQLSKNRINLFLCSIIWLGISGIIIPLYAVYTGYTRLWVAHSIFFYMSIGIGASVFCHWILASNHKYAQYLLMLIAVLLASVFSVDELRHRYIHEIMQDSFHDASMVALFLKKNLKQGDYFYAVCPYGSPLQYELGKLGCNLAISVTKHETGKEMHFSVVKNGIKESQTAEDKPSKERLFVISVPDYHGFVPSRTEMDELIRGTNLENWKKYGLKKVAHFSKTDIYELDFSKIQEMGLIAKVLKVKENAS